MKHSSGNTSYHSNVNFPISSLKIKSIEDLILPVVVELVSSVWIVSQNRMLERIEGRG
jgi:hypothetical protein